MNKVTANELNEIKEESYSKWFERWYAKQNLSKKLKESAMQGYTGYQFDIDRKYDDYTKRRMSDLRLIKKLKEELPDFKIYREEPREYQKSSLGRNLGTGWTSLKIVISWRKSNEI